MRQVVVCVIPVGASLFEVATPSAVWGPHRSASCGVDVEFVACAEPTASNPRSPVSPTGIEGALGLTGLAPLDEHVERADLVVVPTWPITDRPVDEQMAGALRRAHAGGATLVGLCLGAFAIAATGLLDGAAATTHWRQRDRFELDHPEIRFEPNTLYVDEGSIITSAGSAAALDCCLHVLRRDHGAEAAADVARSLVTAPHRDGAQSQFASAPPLRIDDDPISRAMSQAAENIGSIRGVSDLAALAQTSRRSLERHVRSRLGVTPREWIEEQRVIAACRMLESSDVSIDEVARASGYGSTPTLRRAMRSSRATTPTGYRAAFRARSDPRSGRVG